MVPARGCLPPPTSLSCPAVPRLDAALIEVYIFRRRARRTEFLALRRRPGGALPGVWQPVTGRLRRGERAEAGARREVREETGLVPTRLWRLESVTSFYDPGRDAIRFVSLFVAEVAADAVVRLSAEHTAHRFLPAREAARRFLWDSQRRGIAAVRSQVLRGGARARALAIAAPGAGR
jgi:dATP pyrophosphohydrolase